MTSQWLLGGDPEPNIPIHLSGCRFQVRETEQRGVDGTPTSLTTNRKTLLAFIVSIAISLLIGYTLGSLINSYRISNVASIKTINVNVYWNQNCTQPTTFIDWGILEPNSSKTFTVYVKSSSNVPATLLIYTQNWHPTNASASISLTADPNNIVIEASEIIEVTLTLTVASDIEGITDFSFDIMFNGTG